MAYRCTIVFLYFIVGGVQPAFTMRISKVLRNQASWSPLQKGKSLFTNLWSKPETRDERVKEYVPEVLEESLTEQHKVLEESTSRDTIVEAGHRILAQIENKAPTPSIAPHLQRILEAFDTKDLIGQRALSQLLYPTAINASVAVGAASSAQPNELMTGFVENFKSLVEYVEQNGRSATPVHRPASGLEGTETSTRAAEGGADAQRGAASSTGNDEGSDLRSGRVIMAQAQDIEAPDATLFVKLAAGMALSNVASGDLSHAVRCCDAALVYAVDPKRIGGVYGMKAGILNRQRKFVEAAEAARFAIDASDNIQGYLQGAAALKALRHDEEMVVLLEQARDAHPKHSAVAQLLTDAKKTMKLALPDGKTEATKEQLGE